MQNLTHFAARVNEVVLHAWRLNCSSNDRFIMDNARVKEKFAKFLKQQLSKPSTNLITKEKADLIRSYLSEGS